ncbi:ornithine carbamoyltransferase [Streptomyces roseolilacinus]|uniref:ornithine carbamoyltransferase n=1 Tax=Streptomyces roseolilacinus TaxID=66904 RepID=UPI003806835A
MTRRALYSLADLDTVTVHRLVRRSLELYEDPTAHDRPLAGLVAGLLFTKTSTRTRTAFTAGTVRLGGTAVAFGPADLQTNTGESMADTGRMFATMLDLLVVRTAGPVAEHRALAADGALAVVNAMSIEEHPTQGLADVATLVGHFGDLEGVRVLYVGEGNNTATALARALAHYPGCHLVLACPPGYGLPEYVRAGIAGLAAAGGGSITQVHDMGELPTDVHAVYTSRWQTTGSSKPDTHWRDVFRPFHVDTALMNRWPGAVFLHDLPAHRGEEVSGEVLDGKASLAWAQAGVKAAGAMAVLEWVAASVPASAVPDTTGAAPPGFPVPGPTIQKEEE